MAEPEASDNPNLVGACKNTIDGGSDGSCRVVRDEWLIGG
jgi:hypothetical protein